MSNSSLHHSFSVELAIRYGMEKAAIIHHFQYWIELNRRKKSRKHFKEGRWWSYQKRSDIAAALPYLTEESIRHHCEGLAKEGILLMGNFNKSKIDKTIWYAFVDEQEYLQTENSNNAYERGKPQSTGENPNRGGENPNAIPDPISSDPISTDIRKEKESAFPLSFTFGSVKMMQSEYDTLVEKYTKALVDDYIENLDCYSKTHPKNFKVYACHASVIRSWIKKDKSKISADQSQHTEEENRKLAADVIESFPGPVKEQHIRLETRGLVFAYGRKYEFIEFNDVEFRYKLMCRLADMNLSM